MAQRHGLGCLRLLLGRKISRMISERLPKLRKLHIRHVFKEDAEKLSILYISLFSSQGGSPEQMAEYGEALKKGKENEVESYAPMQHGWNAARADFENKEILKHFERGYKQLAKLFTKHLEHRFGPERTSRIPNMETPSSYFA